MAGLDSSQKYVRLNQLSTPQLEDILRADMALPENDGAAMALYIMEIIERREAGKSPENLACAVRAREEFDTLYNTPEGSGQSLYPECPANGGTLRRLPRKPPEQRNLFHLEPPGDFTGPDRQS